MIKAPEDGQKKGKSTHSDPLFGIDDEHFADKVLGFLGNLIGHNKCASFNFLQKDSDVVIIERKSASQKGKEDDAAGPDIRCRAVISFSLCISAVSGTKIA